MNKKKLASLLVPFLLTFQNFLLKEAKAQVVVVDPANLAENILQALRALQSNLNEARMLANQVQQIAHDIRNLTKLPYSILEEYKTQFEELFSEVGSVHGLMQDLVTLQRRFDELYPDFGAEAGLVAGETVSENAERWLEESRQMMLQASINGAKVLVDLPKTHQRLEKLLLDSSNSVGILQATQAGNQIAATVAGNLTNLNTQLATYTQAHNSFLMQLNAGAAAGENRMKHVLEGYKPSSHPGVPLNSY